MSLRVTDFSFRVRCWLNIAITLKYPLPCRRQPPMCIGACAPPASYVRSLPELHPETGTRFVPSQVVGLHSGMHERLPLREWHSTARPGFARCSVLARIAP